MTIRSKRAITVAPDFLEWMKKDPIAPVNAILEQAGVDFYLVTQSRDEPPIWCRLRLLKELDLAIALYVEDDAHPPDAETVDQAYKRLTGRELPSSTSNTWSETYDGGDAFYAYDKLTRLVVVWAAGYNSEIAQLGRVTK